MTRGYRSWFQDLINVWTMPATMLKNKVMYRQLIHSVALCKLKMMYMFKIFVSLLSGHASYVNVCLYKECCLYMKYIAVNNIYNTMHKYPILYYLCS